MGSDSPSGSRRREKFEVVEASSRHTTSNVVEVNRDIGRKSWGRRYKKLLIGGALVIVLLAVLFLILGLTGVLTSAPAASANTTTPATSATVSETAPPVTSATVSETAPPVTSATVSETAPPVTSATVSPDATHPPPSVPIPGQAKIECLPDVTNVSSQRCYQSGCNYEQTTGKVPSCYVNPERSGYTMKDITPTALNRAATHPDWLFNLSHVQQTQLYSSPFLMPQLKIQKKSQSTLQFKFFDAAKARYEVPVPLNDLPSGDLNQTLYEVRQNGIRDTGLQIIRKSTGTVLWDMSLGGLYLEDQFLQITTKLPSTHVYGFGDNRHNNLRHNMDDWRTWPMFSRDAAPTDPNAVNNLYGVHPFYMCIEEDGNAHGVFLLNSNAMEYKFQPAPGLTLRSIGGVLDFHIFMGPTPEEVIQQYTQLLGRSFMPPYWGLGFQISRWGFRDLDHVKQVVNRTLAAGIPMDAVYGDIDYMDFRQDFTYDPIGYAGLPEYVDYLHTQGLRYVIILDPAIHADARTKHPIRYTNGYRAFDEGVAKDIFIKWPANYVDKVDAQSVGPNRAMLGKVWPDGRSAFPDFFKNETLDWWRSMIRDQYVEQGIRFDALWIDMNEVSSFDTNEDASTAWYCNRPDQLPGNHTCFSLQCPKDHPLENPPYKPMAVRNWISGTRPEPLLSDKTLCMMGETSINGKTYSQYDVHSLYGWSQAEVTYRVAQDVRGERSFVFSRSTYPGAQQYVGHWGGDNAANFADLRYSLINLMEYNMFGFSYIGSDICGFFDNTTTHLCARWQAAGAFYPFSRNHNHNTAKDQDPATDPEVAAAAKDALTVRYTLLPYLYTLFYRSHIFGDTVSRPLFHVYPKDVISRNVSDQFFWGPALMISPIVDNVTERSVYIPVEHFYDYYDGAQVAQGQVSFTWKSPHYVPLHLRPGFIIPTQDPATTTTESRKNAFRLLVVADDSHPIAKGELFFDDGKSIDTYQNGKYYLAEFTYNHIQLSFAYNVKYHGDVDLFGQRLEEIKFYMPNSTRGDLLQLKPLIIVNDGPVHDGHLSFNGSIMSVVGIFPMDRSWSLVFLPQTASPIDCAPEERSKTGCEARGCVWTGPTGTDIPLCAFPNTGGIGYLNNNHSEVNSQVSRAPAIISLSANQGLTTARPTAYSEISLQIQEYGDNIVRIKIYGGEKMTDPSSSAGVPCVYAPFACDAAMQKPATNAAYDFEMNEDDQGVVSVKVKRKGAATYIFDTSAGPLVFANQFRQLTTKVASMDVYGIGEHTHNSFRHNFNYKSWGMFARDQPPGGSQNLYGVHPYIQTVENLEGQANGILFLNAHAQEATFSPTPAVTFRAIGGQLDFFVFVGDSPSHVNQLYMGLIGKPFLPPYWALGFQLSRYGYNTFANMSAAVERTLNASIPLDLFYGDIDYFEGEMDFTISQDRFGQLPAYVQEKTNQGLRFVTIQDPCIAALPESDIFQRGLEKKDVFIKWPAGYVDSNNQSYKTYNASEPEYLLGHVWPGAKAVFIDFFHKNAQEWWADELRIFQNKINFSALWIDMNEPASFGTNNYDVWYDYSPEYPWSLRCSDAPTDLLENPPYIPKSLDTPSGRISDKTICMTAQQKSSDGNVYNHYDVHNLYGHSQIGPSLKAMEDLTGKRSFVFSRSTFVGSGSKAGHWLGDNTADWHQLRQSIIGMLEFNLFGIPYVGADICGFFNDVETELCIRWMQLGAFYPFSRNHNGKYNKDQDPAALGEVAARASKIAVDQRYSLLPYLYSLFRQANLAGGTVVRSLMEVFPKDLIARFIDKQFMWGSALLISPVLERGAVNVHAYFPEGDWYDFATGAELFRASSTYRYLPVDIMSIPVHVRGGHIIPMQDVAMNTQESSKTPYGLLIASSHDPRPDMEHHTANGALFWDGGLEIRDNSSGDSDYFAIFDYNLVEILPEENETFTTTRVSATIRMVVSNPGKRTLPVLNSIRILGYPTGVPGPTQVQITLDGVRRDGNVTTVFNPENKGIVVFEDLRLSMTTSLLEIEFRNY